MAKRIVLYEFTYYQIVEDEQINLLKKLKPIIIKITNHKELTDKIKQYLDALYYDCMPNLYTCKAYFNDRNYIYAKDISKRFTDVSEIRYYRSGDPNTIINEKDIRAFAPILIKTNDTFICYDDRGIEIVMIDKREYSDDIYLIKEKEYYTKKAISNK